MGTERRRCALPIIKSPREIAAKNMARIKSRSPNFDKFDLAKIIDTEN